MKELIKKDFLLLSKNKSELIELLLTPFLLICILGFALGNLMNNSAENTIETTIVGFVNDQNDETVKADFEAKLDEENVTDLEYQQLLEASSELDPVFHLKQLFEQEEIKELFHLKAFESIDSAQKALENDEIGGIIHVPDQFSLSVLNSTLFGEELKTELNVMTQDLNQIRSITLTSVLDSFINEYNFQTSIVPFAGDTTIDDTSRYGETLTVSTEEPISAFQYYTLGMGVFYALSISTIIANRSFREKETHVFARIMISNQSPLSYLMSKMVSSSLIAFMQLSLLFGLSNLVFGIFSGRPSSFWLDIALITAIYSLLIGSITSLLTSISLYGNEIKIVNFFGSFTAVLAFLGGSFTPTENFSDLIKTIGDWTPNGATLTSYLQLLMGFEIQEILPLLARVIGMSIVSLTVAVLLFPKRRLD